MPRLFASHLQFDYIVLSDLREAIARYANEVTGRVLDYGCGKKPYAPLFNHATEYVGADFPDNPHANVHLDPLGRLPNLGGFDVVISTQVLEHVPDVSVYLAECHRVLEERKGKLILTTHGIWEYHPAPKDLYRWTHEGLIHVIEAFGFKTCEVEPVTTGLKAVLQIVACRIHQRPFISRRLSPFSYLIMNHLADLFAHDSSVESRLRDFPICYLYFGTAEERQLPDSRRVHGRLSRRR